MHFLRFRHIPEAICAQTRAEMSTHVLSLALCQLHFGALALADVFGLASKHLLADGAYLEDHIAWVGFLINRKNR